VTKDLILGTKGIIDAVPGTIIHMTGSNFSNGGWHPELATGLQNLTLSFEGGPSVTDSFEVSGHDFGGTEGGFTTNFTLGTLVLGGAGKVSTLKLTDDLDNNPDWNGNEVLYVDNLVLNPGSVLNLNGKKLFYHHLSNSDGQIQLNGGSAEQVPEPGSTAALLIAGFSLATRRAKRRVGAR
jgi:hypothetical protein